MSTYRTLLTVILCIALLVMRMGSAHLHFCLDGQEPPASIEFQYGEDLIEPGNAQAGPAHQDYDIDLGGGALGKLPKLDSTLVALLFAFALWLLPRRRPQAAAWQPTHRRPYSPPHHLRPPPCGPPLSSVV